MKPVQIVLTIVFAFCAIGFTVWLGRTFDQLTVAKTEEVKPPTPPKVDTSELPIPTEGPFGKAVVEEKSFDFGTVEKGATGSHNFLIKNEGPGPLRIKGGKTSCQQCTIGKVSTEDDIPPGGSAELEIKWKISQLGGKFRQTADVHTTDPQHPKLTFAIEGLIDSPLHLSPDGTWPMGELADDQSATAEGLLFSTHFDDLQIEKFECTNPLVTITWEPASEIVLKERSAKSAIKVKATLAPGSPVGPFRETVVLHTNARGGMNVEFSLSARCTGPLEVKGKNWNGDSNICIVGEFPAETGAKRKLSMYVRNFDGQLEAEQVDADKTRAKVRINPNGKMFGKSKVFDIEVEVPPGPSSMRQFREAEPVLLKLNHPTVHEFKMYVDYFAR